METTTEDPRLGLPSASSMARVMACPGSVNAERGLVELKTDSITESGTAIHESLHTGDEESLGMTEREIKERLSALELDATRKWASDGHLGSMMNPKPIREQRFWLRKDNLEAAMSGQPDYVVLGIRSMLGLNFKTGYADSTPSEINWQCRAELVVVWSNNPHVEHARWGIAASRLSTTLDTTDYERSDYNRFKYQILDACWKAEQPDAPRVPGSHCRWCKARGLCRENAVYNMIVVNKIPVSTGKPDDLAIIGAVQTLTAPELGFVYSRKGSIEVLMEAVKQRLLSLPEEELKSAGYVKTDGVKRGTIINGAKAFHRLETILTPEERVQCIKIDRAKAVELYSEHATGGSRPSQKRAKDAVDAALGDVLEFKEGQPRLKAI